MRANPSEILFSQADPFDRWGGRAPILIGATGHRSVASGDERLANAVKAECAHLRKHYKHSFFVVLSSLAEGADRRVARVAMEELSAELIAVLPMPQNEYERDFQTDRVEGGIPSFPKARLLCKRGVRPRRRRIEGHRGRTTQSAICARRRHCRGSRPGVVRHLGRRACSRDWRDWRSSRMVRARRRSQ